MDIINDENFKSEVLDYKGVALVDFFAEWCGPCRQMLPLVTELSSEMAGKVKIVKMNIDDAPKTPSQYDIQTIPTFIIFKDGQIVDRKVGSMTKSQLTEWVNSHV